MRKKRKHSKNWYGVQYPLKGSLIGDIGYGVLLQRIKLCYFKILNYESEFRNIVENGLMENNFEDSKWLKAKMRQITEKNKQQKKIK